VSSSSVQLQPQFVQQYVPFPGFSPIEYMSPPIAVDKTTLPEGCDTENSWLRENRGYGGSRLRVTGHIAALRMPSTCAAGLSSKGGTNGSIEHRDPRRAGEDLRRPA
jgi:hypothetical protein